MKTPEESREYMRRWYLANRERLKALRDAAKDPKKAKPPKIPKIVQTPDEKAVVARMKLLERQIYFKAWLAKHPGYMRRDHLKRKGTPKRKADLLKAHAKWQTKNPEKVRAYSRVTHQRQEQKKKLKAIQTTLAIQAPAVFDPDESVASPQLDHETSTPHPHSFFEPEFV